MENSNLVIVAEDEPEELTTVAEVVWKLEEAWMNEKHAPDLLLYEGELVECLLDQLEHMENSLQKIKKEDFRMVIHKMELDRIKYMLNSYLRVRLQKIEKFGAYLLHQQKNGTGNPDQMSANERKFAENYVSGIERYLHDAALKHMPTNMQALKLHEICTKPKMNTSVFIKVKKECPGILLEETTENGEEEILDFEIGSRHVLNYSSVEPLVKRGIVSLI